MKQVKPVICAGSVRFAEKSCVTKIVTILKGLVGCFYWSEVTGAGGPRRSIFILLGQIPDHPVDGFSPKAGTANKVRCLSIEQELP